MRPRFEPCDSQQGSIALPRRTGSDPAGLTPGHHLDILRSDVAPVRKAEVPVDRVRNRVGCQDKDYRMLRNGVRPAGSDPSGASVSSPGSSRYLWRAPSGATRGATLESCPHSRLCGKDAYPNLACATDAPLLPNSQGPPAGERPAPGGGNP